MFYHQLWLNGYAYILEIVLHILEKLTDDLWNVCGCLTLNKIHIELASSISFSINNNLTNTSSTAPNEVKNTVHWKFKDKSLTCFKHQISITAALLFCGSFFQFQSVFRVKGVFKCNKLAVHFKLTLGYLRFYIKVLGKMPPGKMPPGEMPPGKVVPGKLPPGNKSPRKIAPRKIAPRKNAPPGKLLPGKLSPHLPLKKVSCKASSCCGIS